MLNQRIQEIIFRALGSSLHLFPSPTHVDHYVLKPTEHFGEGVFLSSLHVYLCSPSTAFFCNLVATPRLCGCLGFCPFLGNLRNHRGSGACRILIVQIQWRGWATWGSSLLFCEPQLLHMSGGKMVPTVWSVLRIPRDNAPKAPGTESGMQ